MMFPMDPDQTEVAQDAWQDSRVEAELGLRFYLEGFASEQRTFEFYVGPTNSGKTHAAIDILRASESGIYLAPSRLLAIQGLGQPHC